MKRPSQRGAAILTAMLLVTLVASLSAAALWQQWRGIEVETAERARTQASWIVHGALDWARLILREDARTDLGKNQVDHPGEPWAVALQEARLSTFLAASSESGTDSGELLDAFLSGQIIDLQARLNITSLIKDGNPNRAVVLSFARLFDILRLPPSELAALVRNLQLSLQPDEKNAKDVIIALFPQSVDQLIWLGLSQPSILALKPYITVLAEATPVNLNTASAQVLYASIDKLSMADAQRMLSARAQSHFQTLADAKKAIGVTDVVLDEALHSVNSRFFQVTGQLRLENHVVQERSVVQRDAMVVKTVWRERGAFENMASLQ